MSIPEQFAAFPPHIGYFTICVLIIQVPPPVELQAGFKHPNRQNSSRLPDDLLTEFRRVGRRCDYSAVMRSLFGAMPSFVAAQDLYERVSVPVTLVYGDKDWAKPEECSRNHQLVKGSKLITLDNTGHFASLERPDAVARIILDEARAED